MYTILSNRVSSTCFHFCLLKLPSAKDDQKHSQLLMEGYYFDILCQIAYRGFPTKEKVSSTESVRRHVLKKVFFVFSNFD